MKRATEWAAVGGVGAGIGCVGKVLRLSRSDDSAFEKYCRDFLVQICNKLSMTVDRAANLLPRVTFGEEFTGAVRFSIRLLPVLQNCVGIRLWLGLGLGLGLGLA